jgi:hypothetical protein
VLVKGGLEGITFGSSIQDTISLLTKKGIVFDTPTETQSSIYVTNIQIAGVPVSKLELEFNPSKKLKRIGVETSETTWEKTSEYASTLKNKAAEIYGAPKSINNITKEFFDLSGATNQDYTKWALADSLFIYSLIYKQSGKYSVGFFVDTNNPHVPAVPRATPVTLSNLTKAGKRVQLKHPEWDDEICNSVGDREIYVGMTKEQVRAAWGRPYNVNKTTTAYGTTEQWVMHESGRTYVYFSGDTCTAFQN